MLKIPFTIMSLTKNSFSVPTWKKKKLQILKKTVQCISFYIEILPTVVN